MLLKGPSENSARIGIPIHALGTRTNRLLHRGKRPHGKLPYVHCATERQLSNHGCQKGACLESARGCVKTLDHAMI